MHVQLFKDSFQKKFVYAGTVELRNEISRRMGCSLPGTLVFDYPSISAITSFLATELLPEQNNTSNSGALDAVSRDSGLQNIKEMQLGGFKGQSVGVAITAIRGQLPSTSETFHTTSMYSDAIQGVPYDRWDSEHRAVDGGASALGAVKLAGGRFGGFIQDWVTFDSEAFAISPSEAYLMDPQQRVLLQETAGLGLSDATIGNNGFISQTAVAVGIAKLSELAVVAASNAQAIRTGSSFVGTGRALSAASGRLSYTYGLRGPAVSIDTACSSSLVASHYISTAILTGSSSMGVAAGVNLPMQWETTAMFVAAGMMSLDGRCKTLDAAADGYVRSEACIVIKLERTDRVSATPTGMLAMLKGGAINQDGRSSSLTAPHGPSQQAVIFSAAASGGLALSELVGIQMHGTGTALGDPIEVGAIAAVTKRQLQRPLVFTASKSMFGHSETASGVLGMSQAVQGLVHQLQQPILHLRILNGYVSDILAANTGTSYCCFEIKTKYI